MLRSRPTREHAAFQSLLDVDHERAEVEFLLRAVEDEASEDLHDGVHEAHNEDTE